MRVAGFAALVLAVFRPNSLPWVGSSLREVFMAETARFEKPNALERAFGSAIGFLLRLGVGPSHMRVLEVRGRKSGKLFTLPVDLLSRDGKLYLVAPRGHAQWVRNAESAGAVVLRRGSRAQEYRLRVLGDAEKPPILKAYLDSFRSEVQRFFPLAAGSPVEQFAPLVTRYPAFELISRS
jgi:deazaflavin-dependent oxidoreductase (nitroreductase family)